MKILCVCQGGNVRSVTLAYLLKYKYGQDAIAAGWQGNTRETLDLLSSWADHILVAQPEFLEKVSEPYRAKVIVTDVGQDRWFMSLHPELLQICDDVLGRIIAVAPAQEVAA